MNRYVNLEEAGGSYMLEIGHKAPSGNFVALARTNPIQTGPSMGTGPIRRGTGRGNGQCRGKSRIISATRSSRNPLSRERNSFPRIWPATRPFIAAGSDPRTGTPRRGFSFCPPARTSARLTRSFPEKPPLWGPSRWFYTPIFPMSAIPNRSISWRKSGCMRRCWKPTSPSWVSWSPFPPGISPFGWPWFFLPLFWPCGKIPCFKKDFGVTLDL